MKAHERFLWEGELLVELIIGFGRSLTLPKTWEVSLNFRVGELPSEPQGSMLQ